MAILGAQQTAARVALARHLGLATRRRRVPRAHPPSHIEADYAAVLVGYVDRIRAASQQLVADLPTLLRTDDGRARRARAGAERVRAVVEQHADPARLEAVADQAGRRISAHHRGQLARQGKAALGVDLVLFDPEVAHLIDGFVHENVALIRSLQGRALADLEVLITRAVANGTRADVVAGQIADRFQVAERGARFIARDQVARLNSQLTEARHRELGITAFQWITMRDNRVRPEHRQLHGKRFLYAAPPAEGLPGRTRRPGCRCIAHPVFDELLALAAATAA